MGKLKKYEAMKHPFFRLYNILYKEKKDCFLWVLYGNMAKIQPDRLSKMFTITRKKLIFCTPDPHVINFQSNKTRANVANSTNSRTILTFTMVR